MINDTRANAPKRRERERERERTPDAVVPFAIAFAEFYTVQPDLSNRPSVRLVLFLVYFSVKGSSQTYEISSSHCSTYEGLVKRVKETIFLLFDFSFGSRFSTGTGSSTRLFLLLLFLGFDTWLEKEWLVTICQNTIKVSYALMLELHELILNWYSVRVCSCIDPS